MTTDLAGPSRQRMTFAADPPPPKDDAKHASGHGTADAKAASVH
jgi:hypothetical protein